MTDLPSKDSKNQAPKAQITEHKSSVKPERDTVAKVVTSGSDTNQQQIIRDPVTVSKQSPTKKVAPVKEIVKKTNPWVARQFQVRYLKGHADVITCIVVDCDILVTGRYVYTDLS